MERKDRPAPITPQAIARAAEWQRWCNYLYQLRLLLRTPCACDMIEEDAALQGYVDEYGHGLPIAMSPVDPLAEWIFARHVRPAKERIFKLLYKEALADADIGTGLLKKDLLAAFEAVYATEKRHPPAGGWPLQPKYQERWRA
jgi:hypothetical protein